MRVRELKTKTSDSKKLKIRVRRYHGTRQKGTEEGSESHEHIATTIRHISHKRVRQP